MISSFKKTTVKWAIAALALTLVVGCSSLSNPINPTVNSLSQSQTGSTISSQQNAGAINSTSSSPASSIPSTAATSNSGNSSSKPSNTVSTVSAQPTDSSKALLLKMLQLAQQGKIINSDFPAKTSNIADVEQA